MNFLSVRVLSLSFALALSSLSSIPAYADDKQTDELIGGIALGILGAAIASQHHDHGSDYHNHNGVSKKENLVGRCMHRTKKAMANQGYHNVKFERTLSHGVHENGTHFINLEASRSKHHHHHQSNIKVHCSIRDDKVVKFHYSKY